MPPLLGFGCPDRIQVGPGVSEVLAAFCTTLRGHVRNPHATLTFAMLHCRACDSSNDLLSCFWCWLASCPWSGLVIII